MSDIIRLLPDSLANQIAAGEVVQRPASAVKELLENSIDAGATKIQLIIKESGKSLIQVIDNGTGMNETDARMSFERHATSKIAKSEDLFRIKTMGFRGEALASIAAVAQVDLKTKQKGEELGTFICIEGSEIRKQEPTATAEGTSIWVKNLFFNVPARRNFLKSNPVEMRHIVDEFHRVALANAHIAFSLHQNDMEVSQMEPGKLSKRIVSLFGKTYQQQLIPCEEDTPHLRIHGYIGKPEFSKKTKGEQFFFINNRFIKNNYLNHAVVNAYEGLIAPDQYPFYVLFIEMDPKHIDVNVHPTKTEVKFEDERTVYGIIRSGVKQALGAHNVTPSLDFSADVNFETFSNIIQPAKTTKSERNYGQLKSGSLQDSNLKNWQQLYDFAENEDKVDPDVLKKEGDFSEMPKKEHQDSRVIIKSKANGESSPLENQSGEVSKSFQLHGRYVFRQIKTGLMIVDQKLAHERILYERYIETLQNKSGVSQHCLFPQTIDLNLADFSLITELKEEIGALGFVFDIFGKNSIIINGIPSELHGGNEKEIFEGLIEQFKRNKQELSLSNTENLARAMSKRSAIKDGQRLQAEERDALIDRLFACKQPNYTAEGHPTFTVLSLDKIADLF